MSRITNAVFVLFMAVPVVAYPEAASKPTGRFVAVTPPSTSESGYANFLWVLDTQTGDVVAYRVANAKNADGSGSAWVRERIYTEEEYFLYKKSLEKTPEK